MLEVMAVEYTTKPCESCLQPITPENAHPIARRMCNPCFCKCNREKRTKKEEDREEAQAKRAKVSMLSGGTICKNGYHLCPNFKTCHNVLAPGMVFRHHPNICKRCFIKEEVKRLAPGTHLCGTCKEEVAQTDFYPTHKNICKKCHGKRTKTYREWRRKINAEAP